MLEKMSTTDLILIAGLPRSGTSWLGKIFDSHPDTAYRCEPDNDRDLVEIPLFPGESENYRHQSTVQTFAATLPRLATYRLSAKPPLFRKSYHSDVHHYLFRITGAAARFGDRVWKNPPVFGARVDRVKPSPVMVWKSIQALGQLGLIIDSLPKAKAIHIIRHPCGHISSLLRGEDASVFEGGGRSEWYGVYGQLLQLPQAQQHALSLDKLKRLAPEERLAWYWVLVNEKAIAETGTSDRVRTVRYEDLCADRSGTVRELFQFSGLKWSTQTEHFLDASTSKNSNRYFSVFKDPAKSVNRWRNELSPGSIDRIMGVVHQSTVLSPLYSA